MCVYYTVNLSTPEAYPARVQHAVRTAEEDDRFSFWFNLNKVAVRPDVVETVEISRLVLLTTGVAEEANGHVGKWLRNRVRTSAQRSDHPCRTRKKKKMELLMTYLHSYQFSRLTFRHLPAYRPFSFSLSLDS